MSGLHEEKIKNLISQEVMASAREIFEPMGKKFLDQLRVKMLFKLNEEFKVKKESDYDGGEPSKKGNVISKGRRCGRGGCYCWSRLAKNLNQQGLEKGRGGAGGGGSSSSCLYRQRFGGSSSR
jgi:hypothetical protein